MATDLELGASPGDDRLVFRLARQDQQLLSGTIPTGLHQVQLNRIH
jgi:hypothetical protein